MHPDSKTKKMLRQPVLHRIFLSGFLILSLDTAFAASSGVTLEYLAISALKFLTNIPYVIQVVMFVTGFVLTGQGVSMLKEIKKNPQVRAVPTWTRIIGGVVLICAVTSMHLAGSAVWGDEAGRSLMSDKINETQKAANGSTLNACLSNGDCDAY